MEETTKSFSFKANRPIELRVYNYFTGEMMYGPTPDQPSTSWLLGLGDQFPRMICSTAKDNTGKKIWEGDVLQDEKGDICFVSWSDELMGLCMRDAFSNMLVGHKSRMSAKRITGHIYEEGYENLKNS